MMKNNILPAVLIVLLTFGSANAQENSSPENARDTTVEPYQKEDKKALAIKDSDSISRLKEKNVPEAAPSILFSNLGRTSFSQERTFLASAYSNETVETLETIVNGRETHNQAPWFVRRFHFESGLFIPFNNTNVRVGTNSGAYATDIDFENELGFNPSSFSAFANFQWHISRRSKLKLSYFNLRRSSDHSLDKTIVFADHTFPLYAEVNAFFNTHIAQISYGYSILSRPKYELGVMIGAHVLNVNVGVGLNTSIGSVAYSSDYNFTAPLPDIGVYGGYAISDQWAVNAELGYLAAKIDNIDGKIINYNVSVLYKPFPNLGFSANFTGLNFELDAEGKHMNGFLKWGYNGPSLAATYTFGRSF